MARTTRDTIPDFLQEAKELAKAEKELGIVHWIRTTIGYRDDGVFHQLYQYDFPQESRDRYNWIIRWRKARLQCQFPRQYIDHHQARYDKNTELRTDFKSCLGSLAASKAQITKAKRSREAHVAFMREKYSLFCDPQTGELLIPDPELEKFDRKLAKKEENYLLMEESIRNALEQRRREQEQIQT